MNLGPAHVANMRWKRGSCGDEAVNVRDERGVGAVTAELNRRQGIGLAAVAVSAERQQLC